MVTHYYNKTMIDFGEGTLNPHRTHYNDTVNIKTVVLIFYPNVTLSAFIPRLTAHAHINITSVFNVSALL